MDSLGPWRENVFVEHSWKSVIHEEAYLKANDRLSATRASLAACFQLSERSDNTSPSLAEVAGLPAVVKTDLEPCRDGQLRGADLLLADDCNGLLWKPLHSQPLCTLPNYAHLNGR